MENSIQEQRKKGEKGQQGIYVKLADFIVVFQHCFLECK